MEDYDTGEEDFYGNKICIQNITMDNITEQNKTHHNYDELEGRDRCPSLTEKSAGQFSFRVLLYLVIFTMNVIAVNILIGQISITLNKIMIEGDKDYNMYALALKTGYPDRTAV